MIFRTRPRTREDQPVTDQPMDIVEPANQKETKFVETYLKAAENVEMTDQDVEIAENHGTEFKHESLMEYSNIQLDFIKVFGERVFVMVIGTFIILLLYFYNRTPIHMLPTIEFKLCQHTMFHFGIF